MLHVAFHSRDVQPVDVLTYHVKHERQRIPSLVEVYPALLDVELVVGYQRLFEVMDIRIQNNLRVTGADTKTFFR